MRLGLGVFVNTLVTPDSWGVGDFADVEELAAALRDLGFDFLFLGPTGACPASGPVPASPYSPQSRGAGSFLHIRPERLPGWDALPAGERRALRDRARRLNARPLLDLTAARDLKLEALRAVFDCSRAQIAEDVELAAFRQAAGHRLERLSSYFAGQVRYGPDWRRWPVVNEPDPELTRFFSWCQWQLDRQLARAATVGVPLVTDLPVGTPHAGADAWLWQAATLPHRQLGSPPDYFNPEGHRWGLIPFDPQRLEACGFRPLVEPLEYVLRHAAGVRIDHAFGLLRVHCSRVASGIDPAWLPQSPQLVSAVAACARRAGGFVVSEELGAPPPGSDALFRAHGFLKQVPFISDQFDAGSPPDVLSLTCHDLPTLPGCLHGQPEAPVLDPAFRARAAMRIRDLVPDVDRLSHEDAVVAINRALSGVARDIVVTSPEDVLGIHRPVNLPGVAEASWPSFLHRLPTLDALTRSPVLPDLVREVKPRELVPR